MRVKKEIDKNFIDKEEESRVMVDGMKIERDIIEKKKMDELSVEEISKG